MASYNSISLTNQGNRNIGITHLNCISITDELWKLYSFASQLFCFVLLCLFIMFV